MALMVSGDALADSSPPVRRALVIGIQSYTSARRGAETPQRGLTNLDGAVNDARAMAELLSTRYGFDEVELLLERDATRANILARTRSRLIEPVTEGDVSVLYYAGHGSQIWRSTSSEDDCLDETIVPFDSAAGADDIRDQEFRSLFNEMLDRGAGVTAIFDSCHSGSVSRGWPEGKARYIAPDPRDAATLPATDAEPLPETRGAVILTAALETQRAVESIGDDGLPHGVFTNALLRALRTFPRSASAADVFRYVRVALESSMRQQVPTLAGLESRRKTPLFGSGAAEAGRMRVAVTVSKDRAVEVHGGTALGLAPGTELRAVSAAAGPLRLKITAVDGLSRSRAAVLAGDAAKLTTGMLFDVDRWVVTGKPLRLWWAQDGPPLDALLALAPEAQKLADGGLRLVDDPTEEAPDAVLRWLNGGWQLVTSRTGTVINVGMTIDAPAIARRLSGGARLFISLPPPAEMVAALTGTGPTPPDPASADYILQGRIAGGTLAYAWTVPNALARELAGAALPARTAWIRLDSIELPDPVRRLRFVATELDDLAIGLNRVRLWRELQSPPDATPFPYRLVLKRYPTGEIVDEGTVRGGERYVLTLVRRAGAAEIALPHWIYVFIISSDGEGRLLVPGPRVENYFGPGEQRPEIPLGGTRPITAPYGVDTLFLLTSADRIDQPEEVFKFVRLRSEDASPTDPLAALLKSSARSRADERRAVPMNWTLDRLSIRSVAP